MLANSIVLVKQAEFSVGVDKAMYRSIGLEILEELEQAVHKGDFEDKAQAFEQVLF